ncbi:AAA family ATPase [bacterium]|jgi:transitional endoplasmic reticulum ATPase|nr:AAA family ATPase [bacterium]MBT5015106.1 AAA family ATPase [bacterium]
MKLLKLIGLLSVIPCFGDIAVNGNNYFVVTPQQVKPFDEYIGDLPSQLEQLLQYIQDPAPFHKIGVFPSTTLLLVGPPGSGKTSLIKAIAKSTDSVLIRSIGSDFVDKFVGVGAQRVRAVFEQAREAVTNAAGKKVILFIDEIDAIGCRDNMRSDDIESSRTVNALLAEIEEANTNPSLIVVGATNFIDRVDKALLRPGRFDATIRIGLPDISKRVSIMKCYAKRYHLDEDVDFEKLAHFTEGFTPADLEFVTRDAGLRALNGNLVSVTFDCFVQAIDGMLHSLKNRGDENAALKLDSLACITGNSNHGFKALLGDIPAEILEVCSFLKDPQAYQYYGIEAPKGVLVTGPHGCGKTSLVRALAQEVGCEFFYMSGTEFVEQYFGLGAKKMRGLFDKARSLKESNPDGKVLIFIDEIDAIASLYNQGTEYQQTLSELLIQMDGFNNNDSIIVFAATSKRDSLNPAILSSGRFDVQIQLTLPSKEQRLAMITSFCNNKPLEDDTGSLFNFLVDQTQGFDIAQIKALINNAARRALSLKAERISLSIFETLLAEKKQHAHKGRV